MSISTFISKLNEHNYRTWAVEAKDLLRDLNVWRVVDGSEIIPRPPATLAASRTTVTLLHLHTPLTLHTVFSPNRPIFHISHVSIPSFETREHIATTTRKQMVPSACSWSHPSAADTRVISLTIERYCRKQLGLILNTSLSLMVDMRWQS